MNLSLMLSCSRDEKKMKNWEKYFSAVANFHDKLVYFLEIFDNRLTSGSEFILHALMRLLVWQRTRLESYLNISWRPVRGVPERRKVIIEQADRLEAMTNFWLMATTIFLSILRRKKISLNNVTTWLPIQWLREIDVTEWMREEKNK